MGRPGYPKDVREFREKFSSDAAWLEYLIQCRWPEGFVCPKCFGKKATLLTTRPVFQCWQCRHQTYVMAGTIMHRSHLPLREWFYAEKKRRERAGRLRLALISDATENSLGTFLTQNIETGSRVRTDGWPGSETALTDYIHHVRIVGSPTRAHKRFPHIHRVFGNLKAWLNGTHHGVEPKHLPSYLDEFVFRFNRRKTPMAAFQTLLGISSQKKLNSVQIMMAVKILFLDLCSSANVSGAPS